MLGIIWRIVRAARWGAPERLGGRFLADFAQLLDSPEFVDDLGDRLRLCAFLKGGFHGRTVVVMLQRGQESACVVLSMETHATRPMYAYEFAEYKGDRDGERALFALQARHALGLKHEDRRLTASWGGDWRFEFGVSNGFTRSKWQSVLEAMDTLAGSLERREAGQPVPPASR